FQPLANSQVLSVSSTLMANQQPPHKYTEKTNKTTIQHLKFYAGISRFKSLKIPDRVKALLTPDCLHFAALPPLAFPAEHVKTPT
ncbi:hypothetical protein RCN66_05180, partial [Escherichia marmotae]|nr:hypothetical protein [Escherichia marmotae]